MGILGDFYSYYISYDFGAYCGCSERELLVVVVPRVKLAFIRAHLGKINE